MIHRSKNKRKINNNIIQLFQGWRFVYGEGYNKDGQLYMNRTLIDNKKNSITFHYYDKKLSYWNVNKNNKKHTQTNINEFIRICNDKYQIKFKLNHNNRI